MINLNQNIHNIEGTTRSERYTHPLIDSRVKILDYKISSFYENIIQLSKLIVFYNDHNKIDGTWHDLLANDYVFSLISIKEIDVSIFTNDILDNISLSVSALETSFQEDTVKIILKDIFNMFRKIEDAYIILSKNQNHISNSIRNLIVNDLSYFFSLSVLISQKTNFNKILNFGDYWKRDINKKSISVNKYLKFLGQDASILFSSIKSIIQLCADEYKMVVKSGNIHPHIGLLLSFQQLLFSSQQQINKISDRHLDYYYQKVLKIPFLTPKPNIAHVQFLLSDNINDYMLKQGDVMIAGKRSDGEDILYEIQHDTQITKATIKKIYTTDCNADKVSENRMLGADSYQLVYNDESNHYMDVPKVGFVFGADILALDISNRKITLEMKFEEEAFNNVWNQLMAIYSKEGNYDYNYLSTILNDLFFVSYSYCDQWLFSDKNESIIDYERKSISVVFFIDDSNPPLTISESIEYMDSKKPLIKCEIRSKYYNLIHMFSCLSVNSFNVNIDILDLKNLELSNDLGLINKELPYYPFGPTPIIGSSFSISHSILNYKLQDLILSFEWHDVPLHEGGFREYYQDYYAIEDNTSFKISMSSKNSNADILADDKQVFDLFSNLENDPFKQLDPNHQAISSVSRFNNIDLERLFFDEYHSDKYFANKEINIELVAPNSAFGHEQYPEIVRVNSLKSSKKGIVPLPNTPYTPKLKCISLDASFSQEYKISSDGCVFYNIYPFLSSKKVLGTTLLPSLGVGSTIFLEISDMANSLSLEFVLSNIQHSSISRAIDIKWSIYFQQRWNDILEDEILQDTTSNMTSSGFIVLDITRFNNDDISSLTDDKNIWVKMECGNNTSFGISISEIIINSTSLICKTPDLGDENTGLYIEDFRESRVEVDNIVQKYPAKGGTFNENRDQYNLRVSELLKHKNRAVSISDYESLLLQNFKDIYLVYAIANHNSELIFQTGHVVIIVVKDYHEKNNDFCVPEKFSLTKLSEMREFLYSIVSPAVKISVINPRYETIQTKFNVKFNAGVNHKKSIQDLNTKIVEFLSPWNSDLKNRIKTKNLVNTTQIINFIEHVDYVDKVMNFNLFHIVDSKIINLDTAHLNNCRVKPYFDAAILIPHNEHFISVIKDGDFTDQFGLNDMMIDKDYLVETAIFNNEDGIDTMKIETNLEIYDNESVDSKENSNFVLKLNI